MNCKALKIEAGYDFDGNLKLTLTISRENAERVAEQYQSIAGCDNLDVEIKKHREKRSLDANALFWKCVGGLAESLRVGNEELYLQLLERYGSFVFMVVQPQAADYTKRLFRIARDMGTVKVNGQDGVQLQCWTGSSQYNTSQMSRLIDGTIGECKEAGTWHPEDDELRHGLDLWGKHEEI